jgi:TPR repeat protein
MLRSLTIALLSLLYVNTVSADLYSASNALSRGDYETAVAEFTTLAEKGDDKAQANLGYMYYAGEGVPQDYKQAVFWYRKAAVQGNKDAQYNLAVSYAFGEGVEQDLTEAAIWYRRAGEQGHVVSQYSLGISYAYGEGVPQDQKEAARWFKKAAGQGYARAQVHLGSMYHTGEGVEQDYSEAVRWYRMAADRGDATAQYNLGTMYRSGRGVEQNYAQAKRWFRQSADQGYAAAQNELASLERSAASKIPTRTIQAKPEIFPTEPVEPIVKEELPETTTPEPVAEVEPVQEEKLASNETPVAIPETKQLSEPSSTDEPIKKPLFSVDKKDLLTLDSSQLDIPEPIVEPEASTAAVPDIREEDVAEAETPAEEEIAEIIPAEDVPVDVGEVESDKPVVSAMHSAMGLPQPKSAQEEGEPSENLFTAIGSIFSSDDDSKAEEIEADSETTEASTAITESEPATEIIESESVEEVTETEAAVEEYVAAEDPTLLTEPVDVEEVTEAEATVEEYVAAEDPTLLTDPVNVEEITEAEAAVEEYVAAEDPTLLTEPVNVEEITEAEAAVEEYVAAEDPTLLTEPVDAEEITEAEATVEEYVAAEDPTLLTDPVNVEEIEEETEASGGFFSAIGKLFSGEEKQADTEIAEEEIQTTEEEVIIAKLDEPAPVIEEIELAQVAEDDLSQYSVAAGRRALSYKDYDEAEKQFRPLAEAGDSEAQSHLGSLYYVGNGVEQNFISAFLWYKKAADQGNVDAQYSIGNMYLLGEGIEQGNEEAARWYTLASEQGHVAATSNLNNLKSLASEEVVETPSDIDIASKTEAVTEETTSTDTTENGIADSINEQTRNSDTEQIEETADSTVQEEITDADPITEEYVAAEDPTLLTEPVNVEEIEEETEASGGFFSAIGKFFSGEEKQADTEIAEEEIQTTEEEVIIAKLDEPAPVIEEIELAQDVEDDLSQYSVAAGRRALSNGDYDEAVKQIQPLAEAGDSEAQSHLGSLYYVGSGVEQNFISAFLWYKKAADQGNVDAQYSIGNMYLLGEGIEQDNGEAAKWYALASEQGHVAATGNLNNLKKLDSLASEETPGTPDEINDVNKTEIIEDETTVPVTTENGIADSINEQTQNSDTEQIEQTAGSTVQEEIIDTDPITEEYLAENDPTLLTTEATTTEEVEEEPEGSGGFFSAIGDFFSGEEKQADTEIAEEEIQTTEEEVIIAKLDEPAPVIEEIELAETAEDDLSQYSIAAGRRALSNSDYDEAVKQFQPLAEAGDSEAQSHLGSLYYVGKGVEQDIDSSFSWYKKAAEQGNIDAQYSIGNMYLLGEGVEQNNEEAAKWYTLASEQGHIAASNNLISLKKLDALNRDNKLEQELNEDIVAAEDIATESTDVKSYAEGDAPSTESLQTFLDIESPEKDLSVATDNGIEDKPVVDELVTDAEESIQTTDSDTSLAPEASEQSAFFKSLFGDNETDTTALKESDTINIDDVEPVEETVTETAVAEIDSETDETIVAAATEEAEIEEETKESAGLFGFFGKMFSSDDEKEIVDETNNETEAPQEIAMVEPELEQATVANNEINIIEERIETIEPKTELEKLRPLATQGDQDAQYKLGALYYSGNGVKQDYTESALWYRRAAQQGNVDAQYSLGNMYLMGEGVQQDDNQAAHWYALAADQGHMSAAHNLTNLQKTIPASQQLEIETNIIEDEQIASIDADEEPTVESNTDTTGKTEYEQGLAYAFGDGVPQNDRNAFNLFFAAAEKGYALAQYKVGVAFAYGEGVRQDFKQAAEWYHKAAEQGYTIAQRNLAMMYLDGNGIQQDKVHALAWYRVVASQGNAMDIRRRDTLEKELSEIELTQSQELSNQITSRLGNNTSL